MTKKQITQWFADIYIRTKYSGKTKTFFLSATDGTKLDQARIDSFGLSTQFKFVVQN